MTEKQQTATGLPAAAQDLLDQTEAITSELFRQIYGGWLAAHYVRPGIAKADCCGTEHPEEHLAIGQQDRVVSSHVVETGELVVGYATIYRLVCPACNRQPQAVTAAPATAEPAIAEPATAEPAPTPPADGNGHTVTD